MEKAWFAVVALVYLKYSLMVDAAPICSYGQDACHVPSLADLFDRVIQQSSRMHGISTDLHSEFDQYLPSKNFIGKQRCHTYTILTPDDKEKAQRLGVCTIFEGFSYVQRDELTEVILRLLMAWGDPLSQLHWSMSQDQNPDFNQYRSNKALEISDIVRELKDGVIKVAERMKRLGLNGNFLNYISPESLDPFSAISFYKRGELNSVDHQDLLYCFRRDSHKVKTYLRILKCSTFPTMDC